MQQLEVPEELRRLYLTDAMTRAWWIRCEAEGVNEREALIGLVQLLAASRANYFEKLLSLLSDSQSFYAQVQGGGNAGASGLKQDVEAREDR